MVLQDPLSVSSGRSKSTLTACLAALDHVGIDAAVISGLDGPMGVPLDKIPRIALIDVNSITEPKAVESVRRCRALQIPVVVLIPESDLQNFDVSMDVDDIVVTPPSAVELVLRVRRVLSHIDAGHDHLIRAGNLVINPTSYEVMLNGIQLSLRFKEYELLLLLATNPGRVFRSESLLSRIWSYQYYGGIRTVDVHIRRLRSKLQDSDHQFIETVWNVGYRFRNSD